MNISQDGIDFIKKWEGLRLEAYQDSGGIWTIGYGRILEVKKGDKISTVRAEGFLREDILKAERCVSLEVTKKITQKQFDAMVSFTFNLGNEAFKNSWILKFTNEQKPELVREQFMRFVYVGRDKSQGLVNRRVAEADLYEEGVQGYKHMIIGEEIKANSLMWHYHEAQKKKLNLRNNSLRELKEVL